MRKYLINLLVKNRLMIMIDLIYIYLHAVLIHHLKRIDKIVWNLLKISINNMFKNILRVVIVCHN